MIVRLMGRGQWRLDDALIEELNRIDAALDDDVNRGDATEFRQHLAEMHRLIEERGEPVPAEELLPSDAFVPPVDCSLEELRKLMEPDGLIPGAPAKEDADGR
jgi:hypothetical protein